MEGTREPGLRSVGSYCSVADADDLSLLRLLDKPKLNIERKRSFDERSLSDLSISNIRGPDPLDGIHSPGAGRSGFNTPSSSAWHSFEPHPMVADAWDALRKSMVYFRGQPLGTLAAIDHAAEEVLNYDQVKLISSFVIDFLQVFPLPLVESKKN